MKQITCNYFTHFYRNSNQRLSDGDGLGDGDDDTNKKRNLALQAPISEESLFGCDENIDQNIQSGLGGGEGVGQRRCFSLFFCGHLGRGCPSHRRGGMGSCERF